MHFCCENESKAIDAGASFPLSFAGEGEKVKIVFLRGNALMRERLLSMGICPENELMIVQKHDGGAVLIAKGDNRIALGGGMAHKINVIRC
jgi:Fe2+ transport system protein FeoA